MALTKAGTVRKASPAKKAKAKKAPDKKKENLKMAAAGFKQRKRPEVKKKRPEEKKRKGKA